MEMVKGTSFVGHRREKIENSSNSNIKGCDASNGERKGGVLSTFYSQGIFGLLHSIFNGFRLVQRRVVRGVRFAAMELA